MKKVMRNKSRLIIAIVVTGLLVGAGFWFVFQPSRGNQDRVYVESVAALMGYNQSASQRYMGKVEATQIQNVMKTGGVIEEIYVSEGDRVAVGDALFSYDTTEAKTQISKLTLDIEGYDHQVSTLKEQISALEQEKEQAPNTDQYQYTMDIQAKELEIKQLEASKSGAYQSIETYQKQIQDATVKAKIDGVVKAINEADNSSAFISITATGAYKVKGEVSEQNAFMLEAGAPVICRSRIHSDQTWKGKIELVDVDNTVNQSSPSDGPNQPEASSRYPFYVTLDKADGLLLGQHVYIEMDVGQGEAPKGVWLDPSYVVTSEDDQHYVWVANAKHKLEKRMVSLGTLDEERMVVEITEGLGMEDLLTWPMEGLYEGVSCVTNADEVDFNSPLYSKEAGDADVAED